MFTILRDWSSQYTSPIAEALKEAFRITLFSVPGQLIFLLESKDLAFKVFLINIVLIFLRALDKYIYTKSKESVKEKNEVVKGLSPI